MPRIHQLRSLELVSILLLCFVVQNESALTLYIHRKFAIDQMGYDVRNSDIFLIKNGVNNEVFENPELFRETTRSLPTTLNRVELTWFSLRHEEQYSLRVTSSNLKIMQDPIVKLPSLRGTVSKSPKAFEVHFKCTGFIQGEVGIRFALNYTHFHASTQISRHKSLQFTVSKLCDGNGNVEGNTSSTKKTVNRTVVVTVSACMALIVCLITGGVFFWRYVKRIRRKFGFDETREHLAPTRESFTSSNISIPSSCRVPTVVYSPRGKGGPSGHCISKITKLKPHDVVTHSSDMPSSRCNSPISFNGRTSSYDSQVFTQVSVTEDDVFTLEQSDELLVQKEEHDSLAKDFLSDKQLAFRTLNEYWAEKLGDSVKQLEEVEIRGEVLGEGTFGRVLRGKLLAKCQENNVSVAVKTCQENIEFDHMVSFVNEAILMKGLSHRNLLNLVGVVLLPNSAPYILTPFMQHSDLHKFLRHSRGIGIRRQLIGSRQLVNFASQIARGMEYLTSQKIVHRDLAARNCFVDEDLNVKIGDFGLAREIQQFDLYRMEHPTQLAVKWLALESLVYYIFTEKSDVWSFGILLWELVTLGSQPYAGLDNYEVMPYLETGKRLPRPLRCPDDLYNIMQSCWLATPEERPTFSVLVHKLEDYEQRLRPSCITFEFDEDTIEMSDGLS